MYCTQINPQAERRQEPVCTKPRNTTAFTPGSGELSENSTHCSRSHIIPSQVETEPGQLVPDFCQSVLLHRGIIEQLNSQIKVA